MEDRVPTPGQEGRVLITPEDGSPAFYARVSMADNPTQKGTPWAKVAVLHDDIAALYGLPASAVPNDVFKALTVLLRFNSGLCNEYIWRKYIPYYIEMGPETKLALGSEEYDHVLDNTVLYSDIVKFTGGEVQLGDSMQINDAPMNYKKYNALKGKYFQVRTNSSGQLSPVYYGDPTGEASAETLDGRLYTVYFSKAKQIIREVPEQTIEYLNASTSSAYPTGEVDGVHYELLGKLGDIIRT